MSKNRYTIGMDFGTLSCRALLVNVEKGEEVSMSVFDYTNAVFSQHLPHNKKTLPPEWALQDPADYLRAIRFTIPQILEKAKVDSAQIVGIGVDFTVCTMMPTKLDGTPLCFLEQYRDNPHSYVKLWKHHAAQSQADVITKVALERGETWLSKYGGKISSEWFFSKALQILEESPEIYHAADRLIEAADWVIWQLTGTETRSACIAGYKALVQAGRYPDKSFFSALHPSFVDVVESKMLDEFSPLGSCAGGLTNQFSKELGLPEGTTVAVANIDAHVTAPAVQATKAGKMVMIMGTSTCHIINSEKLSNVKGMCGVVDGGIIPNLYGYEAGQSGVGDIFAWFVDHAVPKKYFVAAKEAGLDIQQYLEKEATKLQVGEHGLIALDWWNGNRSTLVDADLSGIILGMTLVTQAPDIYRALIESTAYGTREIIETFEKNGVPVTELICAGGLPEKNDLLCQIYADVTGRILTFAGSSQSAALGSSMYAAVAAGVYLNIHDAADKMGKRKDKVVKPIASNQIVYNRLYAQYKTLYHYFGQGVNDVMKQLKQIRDQALNG